MNITVYVIRYGLQRIVNLSIIRIKHFSFAFIFFGATNAEFRIKMYILHKK